MIFSKYHYCTLNQKDSDYQIIFKSFNINHKRPETAYNRSRLTFLLYKAVFMLPCANRFVTLQKYY